MKRKALLFIIVMFLFIGVAKAEKCVVESGTGRNIGDEISCGEEHFYVVGTTKDNVKMITKYNLDIGSIYYNEKMDIDVNADANEACRDLAGAKNPQHVIRRSFYHTRVDNTYYCNYFDPIESSKVIQSPKAIGAHGDSSGNPVFPEYGVVHLWGEYGYHLFPSGNIYNTRFEDGEFSSDTGIPDALDAYQDELEKNGFSIKGMEVMTVKDISNIVKEITGKELPLDIWVNREIQEIVDPRSSNGGNFLIGSIKELVPEKYNWLWGTTYWTRTLVPDPSNKCSNGDKDYYCHEYIYFIDSLGNLCNAYECPIAVGAGLRPIVSIAASDLDYKIDTKTDGHGSITVEKIRAHGGEVVKFTIKPEEGYVLGVVKVTDADGNVVYFTDYTFTMPNANVLIEATFVKKSIVPNAETADIAITVVVLLAIITGGFTLSYMRRLRILK